MVIYRDSLKIKIYFRFFCSLGFWFISDLYWLIHTKYGLELESLKAWGRSDPFQQTGSRLRSLRALQRGPWGSETAVSSQARPGKMETPFRNQTMNVTTKNGLKHCDTYAAICRLAQ